ncbi:MAG: ATP-dependent sacrificial sulfur transferase LarE [Nitrospirota bacterium]
MRKGLVLERRIEDSYKILQEIIKGMEGVVIAFSGGVDSSLILKISHDILKDKAVAVTAKSPTYPEHELIMAKEFASCCGIRHIIIDSNELEISGFNKNDTRRCYYCKKELFARLRDAANEMGIEYIADGTNMDDSRDYRPGMDAARELGVRSPLKEAGIDKEGVRHISKAIGLANWDKPSFACLSSRFPYGTEITYKRLDKINKAENIIRGEGFRQYRVRYHGETAKIEVSPDEISRILKEDIRNKIIKGFKEIGFIYITIDLEGYRQGSLNEGGIQEA